MTKAEQLGFGTAWFSDLGVLPSTDPLLSVAMAATWTQRIKLGITMIPFGYTPFVLARQLAQLDCLSRGRVRLIFVPGLHQPGESSALGIEKLDPGSLLDDLIPQLRALWAELPSGAGGSREIPPIRLPILPLQRPLQIWLAGRGPRALARAGRLGDGWRGAGIDPTQVLQARERIEVAAAAAGRTFDPEHFGMTLGYARDRSDVERRALVHEQPCAVGRAALRSVVQDLIAVGVSKFSLRRVAPPDSWGDELGWLADAILDLET